MLTMLTTILYSWLFNYCPLGHTSHSPAPDCYSRSCAPPVAVLLKPNNLRKLRHVRMIDVAREPFNISGVGEFKDG